MREIDLAVFRWINSGWPDAWSPFFFFISEGNKMGGVRLFLAGVVVFMLVKSPRTRVAALLALVAWPLANGFSEALKYGFQMLRPSDPRAGLEDVVIRVGALTSFGTASSHAANMMSVAVVFFAFVRWWGSVWIALAVVTGISRIYVGVHYPSQVLLGWICGAFCALLVVRTYVAFLNVRRWKHERNQLETTPEDPTRLDPA